MRNGRISRLRAFAARALGLFVPRKHDNDFDEEVQAHLQLLTDLFVAQGMSQQDAAAAARRQFGNLLPQLPSATYRGVDAPAPPL
jgi:hypothetical protein